MEKMGTIDEVKKMKAEGKSEGDIRNALKMRGVNDAEIENSLAHSQIRQAVSQPGQGAVPEAPVQQEAAAPIMPGMQPSMLQQGSTEYSATSPPAQQLPAGQDYEGMQPSMMQQEQAGGSYQEGYPEGGGGYAYDDYPAYQSYGEGMSSDVITEISEQVVSERLAVLREKLDQAIDFKNTAETRISSLNERLERIEGIIDRLQLSLLQKVGDYVSDVKDIKQELGETQKSFKKLVPELKKIHGKGKKSVP